MADRLLNTPFETSLRALLLLKESATPLTLDRILAYDFISIYAKEFRICGISINGNNGFAFSEYALKRKLMGTALKKLVLSRLVTVSERSAGFLYQISATGTSVVDKLKSDYAKDYRSLCKCTMEVYGECSDTELQEIISSASIQALKEEA